MRNKTKEELIKELEELQNKLEIAENDVDYWINEYNEMELKIEDLEKTIKDMEISKGIKDTNDFIYKLEVAGLYSDSMQNFINDYLKYYN